jgi:hypothetical protein
MFQPHVKSWLLLTATLFGSLPVEAQATGASEAAGCYRLSFQDWRYDGQPDSLPAFFRVLIPEVFDRPRVIRLSHRSERQPLSNLGWWRESARDSITIWTATVMEGWTIGAELHGESLVGSLRYFHDALPTRRAGVYGQKVACPVRHGDIITMLRLRDG